MDFQWDQTPAWETFVPLESFDMPWIDQVAQPELQSKFQPNMIIRPGETADEARKYTAKDWVTQKAEIARLYENNTLDTVRTIMEERHGLIATVKQYKDRIAKWGLEKKIKTDEMEAMIRKQQERALIGKQSAFRVRKKPVASQKISRYMKEHCIPALAANEDMNVDGSIDLAATPKAISCYTPSEMGPPTPRTAPSPETSSNLYSSTNLQPSLSYGSPHMSSYQFGDPTPMLPNSTFVAQMTGTLHGRPPLPMSMASLPAPFLEEVDEIAFTGQSPAPFSVPPTPRPFLHDVVQEEEVVITHSDGGDLTESYTHHLAWDHGAQPPPNTSTPFPPPSTGTDLLQDRPGEEGDEFSISIDADLNAASFLELFGPTLFSVTDPSIFGKFKVAPTQTETLENMYKLAEGLSSQGKYKAAEKMHRQTLQLRQGIFPPKHPNTLRSMYKLAEAISDQGRYKTAEKIHHEVLQLRREVLGPKHPHTLNSMYSLGAVLRFQGRYKSAEEILRRTLGDYINVVGEANLATLNCTFELAKILSFQGEKRVAEEMSRRVLSKKEELLGKGHLDTLIIVYGLAQILWDQGKLEEAEEMCLRVLREREKELGKKHPDTLHALSAFGMVLKARGKYEEAEASFQQVLLGQEKMLGKEHPFTLNSVFSLASLYKTTKRYHGALLLYRRACAGFEKVLGLNHPQTKDCSDGYSALLEIMKAEQEN